MAAFPPQIDDRIRRRLERLGCRLSDVTERFVRGGGAGGQKINKTSSTVHLRHEPSGLEVRCQRERSQTANRELAWEELCQRLESRARQAAEAAVSEREKTRRQSRQKSRGQKKVMVAQKRRRSSTKQARGRVGGEE